MEGLDLKLKAALARVTELEKSLETVETELKREVQEKLDMVELEKSRLENSLRAAEQKKLAETEKLAVVTQAVEALKAHNAELERVRSDFQRIEKEREQEQQAHQQLLSKFRDSESDILKLKQDLREKTDELQDQLGLQNERDLLDQYCSIRRRGPEMLKFETESEICKALISDRSPEIQVMWHRGLPACIIIMCIHYTEYLDDRKMGKRLLSEVKDAVNKTVSTIAEPTKERLLFWLSNVLQLLHILKQYSVDDKYHKTNTPKQNEQSLIKFSFSKSHEELSDIAVGILQRVTKLVVEKIHPFIIPAILENGSGVTPEKTVPGGVADPLEKLLEQLESTVTLLKKYGLDPEVTQLLFTQLFHFIAAVAFNDLLTRKGSCHRSKGLEIRNNISKLEEWCREKNMKKVSARLLYMVQASKLLQSGKMEKDVPAICEMCDELTVHQVVKLLMLHEPADVHEKNSLVSVVRLTSRTTDSRQQSDKCSNFL